MDCSLLLSAPLEVLIGSTSHSYTSAAAKRDTDEFICGSPKEIGRMVALRALLKEENKTCTKDPLRTLVLLALDELDKRIQRHVIMAVHRKDPTKLEGRDPKDFKVTEEGKIIFREK